MSKKKRNARGSGSITKRADGRWLGRYTVIFPNGQHKVISIYGKTQKEAREKLTQAIAKRDRGELPIDNKLTVEQFYTIWMDEIVDNYLKPTTIELYKRIFAKYTLPVLGKKKLSTLNAGDVQICINLTKKNSVHQARIVQKGLSSMLGKAKKRQLIYYNPARDIEMPKIEESEPILWSKEELKVFLAEANKSSRYYVAYLLMVTLGLRRGEVLGLDWENIDFRNNCIYIRKQIVNLNNRPQISSLKTKSSKRDLPLSHLIADALGSMPDKKMSGLIFKTTKGTPVAPRNFYRDFQRITKKAGVPRIKLHTLRHMAACFMRDFGIDIKTCQTILGHSTISTTLNIYSHSDMEHKIMAVDKMEELISS